MRSILVLALLTITVAISGCATTRDPALVSALNSTRITDIVVEVPPGIAEGIISTDLNGISDKQKAPAVAKWVKSALNSTVKGLPGGARKARLRVTLTYLSVASSAGRIVGSGSILKGTARLEDLSSNVLIVNLGEISGEDRAVTAGGNIGAIVSLAVNIVDAASKDRIKVLAQAFAERLQKQIMR